MKKIFTLVLGLLSLTAFSQLQFTSMGSPITENFEGFDGGGSGGMKGLASSPGAGQLNSNNWIVTGVETTDMGFGDTKTTAKYTSGEELASGVSVSGLTSVFDHNANNFFLGFKSTAGTGTLNPGELILRVQNNSGAIMTSLDVSYVFKEYNQGTTGHSFDFSYSEDGSSYTAVAGLSDGTTQGPGTTNVLSRTKTSTITGLNVCSGKYIYLKWSMAVSSGSSTTDVFGLDELSLTPNDGGGVACTNNNPTAIDFSTTATENTLESINVLPGKASDPDGDPVTITVVGQSNGTAVANGNNIDYTPTATGAQTITYRVCETANTSNCSGNQTISVTVSTGTPPGSGPAIIITEFVSEGGAEWVEIYNNSGATINLADYFITQYSGAGPAFSTKFNLDPDGLGTTLAAGAYTVVIDNGDAESAFTNRWPTFPFSSAIVVTSFGLANGSGGDEIIIGAFANDAVAVDQIDWQTGQAAGELSAFYSGALPGTNGSESAGKTNLQGDSDDPNNWALFAQATPGVANAVINDPPVVNTVSLTTIEGFTRTADVTSNASDPNDGDVLSTSATFVSGPSNGTAVVNTNGLDIDYTPNPGYTGADVIQFEVCDNASTPKCVTATLNITVDPLSSNNAPTANNFGTEVFKDVNNTLPISKNSSDPDAGNTLTASVVIGPKNGAATPNGAEIDYSPNAGYQGKDMLTYAVCDNFGLCDTGRAVLNVVVNPSGSVLAFTAMDVTVQEDFNQFTGTGFNPTGAGGAANSTNFLATGLNGVTGTFGGTFDASSGTSSSMAKGQAVADGVTSGGVYSFLNNGNPLIGVQATSANFTPGTFEVRVQNNTGATITTMNVDYDWYYTNSGDRGNTWVVDHGVDGAGYTSIPSHSDSTGLALDALGWQVKNKTATLTGLSIANGSYFHLRFSSDEMSGGTSNRDRVGFDNLQLTPGTIPTVPCANASIAAPSNITCAAGTVTLDASASTDVCFYEWTTSIGTIDSGADTDKPVVSKAGSYLLTVIGIDGCVDTSSVTVIADATTPSASIAAPDTLKPSVTSVTLDGSGSTNADGYAWSTTDGTIDSGASADKAVVSKAGTYQLIASNSTSGCSDTTTVVVVEQTTSGNTAPVGKSFTASAIENVLKAITVIGTTNVTDAEGDVLEVKVTSVSGGASAVVNANNIDFTATTAGSYTIVYQVCETATAEKFCSNDSNIVVTVSAVPPSGTDPQAGDLLINEFAVQGTAEWVEILNTSSSTFNLKDIIITQLGTSGFSTKYALDSANGTRTIAPGEFIVVIDDSDAEVDFTSVWSTFNYAQAAQVTSLSLANGTTGDEIILLNNSDAVIDSLGWKQGELEAFSGGSLSTGSETSSRASQTGSSDDTNNWALGNGTPGAANTFPVVSPTPQAGDLLINEFAVQGTAEWVEIVNVSSSTFELKDIKITQLGTSGLSTKYALDSANGTRTIAPGEYLVIIDDSDAEVDFTSVWSTFNYAQAAQVTSLTLSNGTTGDEIILVNNSDAIIDSLGWKQGELEAFSGGALTTGSETSSRTNQTGNSDDTNNWALGNGTPGAQNTFPNTVNTPPTVKSFTATATENVQQAITVLGTSNVTDTEGDDLEIKITSVTPTASTSIAGNNIEFTATTAGSYTIVYQVCETSTTDKFCSADSNIVVTVNPAGTNNVPVARDTSLITSEITMVAVDFTIITSDADGDNLTSSITVAPKNGIATVNVNNIEYTPNAGFTGNDTLTYKVQDPSLDSALAQVFITVNANTGGNVVPIATNGSLTVTEGSSGSIDVSTVVTDPDAGDALTVTVPNQPNNGGTVINGTSITYTPTGGFSGADTIEYIACDNAAACDTAKVFVTVNALPAGANPAIEFTALGVAATENFNNWQGNGVSATGDNGTLNTTNWSIIGLSQGDIAFGATDETQTDFKKGTSAGGETSGGIWAFQDGTNTLLGVQPTSSDFTPGEFILKIPNNTGSTVDSVVYSYDLKVFNDQARGQSWYTFVSQDGTNFTKVGSLDFVTDEVADAVPAWKTFAINGTATGLSIANGGSFFIKWMSDDSLATSGSRDEFGIDNINATAFSNTIVTPTNNAPVATNKTTTASENTATVIDLSSNISDADNDLLTLTKVSGPNNGTATTFGTGKSITYTSNVGATTDTIVYQACDDNGACDTASVFISVQTVCTSNILSGKVTFNTFGIEAKKVQLYKSLGNNKFDLTNVISTSSTTDGDFVFQGVNTGTYLIKAKDAGFYPPSYLGKTTDWQRATPVVVDATCSSQNNLNIEIVDNFGKGSGVTTLNGTVYNSVTSAGATFANADVYITLPPRQGGTESLIIAHETTAADGTYNFNNLIDGSKVYIVNVDVPGFVSNETRLSAKPNTTLIGSADFCTTTTDSLKTCSGFALSLNEYELAEAEINVYPNPTQSELYVTYSLVKKSDVIVTVINGIGGIVSSQSYSNQLEGDYELDLSNRLTVAGVYTILININGKTYTTRVSKN